MSDDERAVGRLAWAWTYAALWGHTQHRSRCKCPEDGEGEDDPRCLRHRRYQIASMTTTVLDALDPVIAARAAQPVPAHTCTRALLFHWSPTRNRTSIERDGLRPGNPSKDGDWIAPHLCYATSPSAALGLTHRDEPLDLWMVHSADHFFLANDGTEWRTTQPVKAWLVATRDWPATVSTPRDPTQSQGESNV